MKREGNFKPVIYCIGDGRVNEQVGLASLHVIMLRYHNFLEERLRLLNPHWNGDTLYQQARRMVYAAWQVIIYNEYLPITMGPILMKKFQLVLGKTGYLDCTFIKFTAYF